MNLKEATALFLDSYENDLTRSTYQKALSDCLGLIGADRQVDEVEPADVLRVHNHLRKKNYAPATLFQRIKSVKTFFKWLHDMELIPSNPARVVKASRPKRPRTREKAMTDDELTLILDYVQMRNRRDYAFITFLADTGCRVGGAATLRERDLDFDKREATVTEKGSLTRQVKFGRDTAQILRLYLLWRKTAAPEDDYVFSANGKIIQEATLSQRIRRACYGLRKLGYDIRILSPHSLRHRKGHQLADQKVAPSIAATALGHESVMTTIEYYYPDDWETAAEELDKLALKRDLWRKNQV